MIKSVRNQLNFSMLANAMLATLLIAICIDTLAGAFLFAALSTLGISQDVTLWIESGMVILSLIPAVGIFSQALRAEQELSGNSQGEI